MNNGVEVSIIIPVYNTEPFLNDCLTSLVNQNLKNYEIIIINDGSTDGSVDIINDFIKRYPFIKYYEQSNKGQGAARNLGFKKSSGKYIYFMDSDDYIENNSLQILYNLAISSELDLIVFNGESFLDGSLNKKVNLNQYNYDRVNSYNDVEPGKELFIKMINNNEFFPSPCLYLVRRDVIEKNNIKFIENIIHEDEIFTINIFLYSMKTKYLKEKLFKRRIRNNSTMTSSNYLKKLDGYIRVFKELERKYMTNTLKDRRLQSALYKKTGSIYRGILFSYNSLDKKQKKIKKNELNEIIKIARGRNYYGLKGLILTKNQILYRVLKRIKAYLRFYKKL